MVRIGRNVTFEVPFTQFVNKYLDWLPTRPLVATEPDPTVTKLSAGEQKPINIDIWGEAIDLTDLKVTIEEDFANVEFVINGAAINPEPIPDVEDPPTQDEIDSQQFFADSFNAEFAAMEGIILAAIKVRYDLVNTTPIPFEDVPKSDIKHLRQRI